MLKLKHCECHDPQVFSFVLNKLTEILSFFLGIILKVKMFPFHAKQIMFFYI